MRHRPDDRQPSRAPACPQSGLHVIRLGTCSDLTPRRDREKRLVLQSAVDARLEAWGWRWVRLPKGGRSCALPDGSPCPPISISYSGHTAVILVSSDWRAVGVDIEIMTRHRAIRLAGRLADLGIMTEVSDPANALAVFARAEAWAKADGVGFLFGPRAALWRLGHSHIPGLRPGGQRVLDVSPPSGALCASRESPDFCARLAVCQDMHAEDPIFHDGHDDRPGGTAACTCKGS